MSDKGTEDARGSGPDGSDTFQISITIPAHQVGHDIKVTLSPRKVQRAYNKSPVQTSITSSTSPLSQTHPPTITPPPAVVPPLEFTPVFQGPSEAQPQSSEEVPDSPTPIHPSEGHPSLSIAGPHINPNGSYGRKYRAVYVITRGRKTGVFHEYWADIQYLVKGIKGAKWWKADSIEAGIAEYGAALDSGMTCLLSCN